MGLSTGYNSMCISLFFQLYGNNKTRYYWRIYMNRSVLMLGALLVGCASADRVQKLEEKLENISPSAGGDLAKKVAQLEKEVAELKKSWRKSKTFCRYRKRKKGRCSIS